MSTPISSRSRYLTPDVLARAQYWVRESGVVPIIEQELRKDRKNGAANGRGRPRRVSVEAFLLAALLSVQIHRSLVLRYLHSVLVEALPVPLQQQMGLRWRDESGQVHVVEERHVASTLQAIHDAFTYTEAYACGVPPEERLRRQQLLEEFTDDLVAAGIPDCFEHEGDYALDGCGVDAHCRPMAMETRESRIRDIVGAGGEAAARKLGKFRGRSDWDARGGRRTPTRRKSEMYYGYDLQALVRVNPVARPDLGPLLIEAFSLNAASTDTTEVCLPMLDRVLARRGPGSIKSLLADRWYSYKEAVEWALELIRRGIRQVADYHKGESMTADFKGVRMIAGHPFCPATPQALVDLPRPARWAASPDGASTDEEREEELALKAEIERFEQLVEERQAYAMNRDQGWREKDGEWSERFTCPAAAGKIRCPKRPETLTTDMTALPTVVNPPAADLMCCSGQTFELPFAAMPKMRQQHVWGSAKWRKSYSRRNAVELMFSAVQQPSTENIGPGSIQVFGVVKNSVLLACALAATNIRLSRQFALSKGMLDGRHPLLTPDAADDRWVEPEADEAAA